ncbi:hypothetical protein [Botrimarina hoheduenensis]|uniref:Phosphate-selective porin O and P n=1 Tax=Botrimarina hoheduenensis TaxID=2528000 RepID=A0A5C5VXV2_9BACT|nr:hypothetical protein [Botrimarina hoheduenensis]TWT42743.1 Phosphate-selective porin O and P [Botrimarina hoheduenensis]
MVVAILRTVLLATLASQTFAGETLRRLPPVQATAAYPTTSSPTGRLTPPASVMIAAAYEAPHTTSPAVEEPPALLGFESGDDGVPLYEIGAVFDKGLFIRSTDLQARPYALYVGARMQLRHTGFIRDETTWTDAAGVTREIRNRNNFDTERLRLNLQGTAIDPALSYYVVVDGDADGASSADFLAYIATYEFDPAFKVRMGRWKAASDREWLESSRFFRMTDRSLATEYFRVGFTDGVWLLGDLGDHWSYETSLTNGLRTSTRRPFDQDDNLGAAVTIAYEPLGDFGPGEADYACHTTPVVRLGGSFAYDKADDRSDAGFPLGDDSFLTLSDGTRLSDVGSLAPGVRLLGDRVLKSSLDWGVKYRGWSFSGEYFIRSIQDLVADGPLPMTQLYDYGYRVAGGVFLVPQRFDVNAGMSQVSGLYGDAYEYLVGFNWYWGSGQRDGKLDDRVNKFSMDVLEVKGSPVTSTPADFIAGDDGVMFRTQVQIGF